MDGLYLLFCLVFIVFGVYLLYLQIRMSNDIHTMRELFTSLFDKELKEKEAEVQKQEKAKQQKLIVTAPGINTPDQSKPSPSKNDVDEFLDKIHSYKKEHKEVDKKWLNELINEYNANFNEDFSQYLSLSKDVSAF